MNNNYSLKISNFDFLNEKWTSKTCFQWKIVVFNENMKELVTVFVQNENYPEVYATIIQIMFFFWKEIRDWREIRDICRQ